MFVVICQCDSGIGPSSVCFFFFAYVIVSCIGGMNSLHIKTSISVSLAITAESTFAPHSSR